MAAHAGGGPLLKRPLLRLWETLTCPEAPEPQCSCHPLANITDVEHNYKSVGSP